MIESLLTKEELLAKYPPEEELFKVPNYLGKTNNYVEIKAEVSRLPEAEGGKIVFVVPGSVEFAKPPASCDKGSV